MAKKTKECPNCEKQYWEGYLQAIEDVSKPRKGAGWIGAVIECRDNALNNLKEFVIVEDQQVEPSPDSYDVDEA